MINWSLASSGANTMGQAKQAFEFGAQLGADQRRKNTLAGYTANPEGTRNALLANGDFDTVNDLTGYEQQQAQEQRRVEAAKAAQADRTKGEVLGVAESLYMTPDDQLMPAFDAQGVPALLRAGVPQQVIDQAKADGKITKREIAQFIVQLGGDAPQSQGVNLGGGGYGSYDPMTNSFTELRAPSAPKPPPGYAWGQDGQSLIPLPGGPADPRQAGAVAASRRAPRRSGGGSSASVPDGFVLD